MKIQSQNSGTSYIRQKRASMLLEVGDEDLLVKTCLFINDKHSSH